MPRTARSPVSPEVGAELQRVVERWGQLPLDRALSHTGHVRALVQSLADRVAEARGIASSVVPDLGPATLMDQLTAMVYDASAAALAATQPAATLTAASKGLAADLEALRRELA
jgi:hypothetical protein